MLDEGAIVKRFGVTPEQLIGYAYAGLLAVIISAIIQPTLIKDLVASLGGFLIALAALGLGIGIYALYFKVIGELLLYPIQHKVHRLLDFVRRIPAEKYTSSVAYLGHLGVPRGYQRASYEALKASFYDPETCRRVQVAHGELHVLYLTAVESFVAAIYLAANGCDYTLWGWGTAVVYVAALIADTKQHVIEAAMLRAKPESEVKDFLSKGGYLRAQPSP